ncbi:MAG: hypothetical protein ACOX4I_06165 [Anaerovoracaceae bacterium]|jgi:transposase-like protein
MRTCPKCGSENYVKVVGAKSLIIPEIKDEVKQGITEIACGCHGTFSGVEYRCRDCGFRWDDLIERGMRQSK